MTAWEKKIIDKFVEHYFASVPKTEDERKNLRIRRVSIFPDFDSAISDEKESFIEAAQALEQEGLVSIRWERHRIGERIYTLSCEDFEMLFQKAGLEFPKSEAGKIRELFQIAYNRISEIVPKGAEAQRTQSKSEQDKKLLLLLKYLSCNFSQRNVGQGINLQISKDFIKLIEFLSESKNTERITVRAISTMLYNDSKYLESLLSIWKPVLSAAEKEILLPDFSFLERSFPEALISGNFFLIFKNERQSIFNEDACIYGFPFETTLRMKGFGVLKKNENRTVLTIENKETFYALGSSQKSKNINSPGFDTYLYTGGYPNQAVAKLIKLLAVSNFHFYHAGDLDPDGILILQKINELAGRPVKPLRMDAATFDKYLPWARTLTKPMLQQIKKIKPEIKAIPDLAALIQRIEETGMGIEQEIIDYRM